MESYLYRSKIQTIIILFHLTCIYVSKNITSSLKYMVLNYIISVKTTFFKDVKMIYFPRNSSPRNTNSVIIYSSCKSKLMSVFLQWNTKNKDKLNSNAALFHAITRSTIHSNFLIHDKSDTTSFMIWHLYS